jgi:hypothetical protein
MIGIVGIFLSFTLGERGYFGREVIVRKLIPAAKGS